MLKKEGQFYFIAAFIIIAVLSGLSVIYTSIKTQNENIDVNELAKEVRYEVNQLIDNRALTGVNDNQIADNIKDVSSYYKNRYSIDVIIIYGSDSLGYIINSDAVKQVVPTDKNGKKTITLQLPSEYDFEMRSRYKNLYVVVLREKDGERAIAVE